MACCCSSPFLTALLALLAVCCWAQPPMGPAPPPPPFLIGAKPATIKEFEQLLASSGSLKDTEIDEKVKQWASKQSADIQAKFAAFEKEKDQAKSQGEAAHDAAVKKFSEAAKKADKELNAIANNPDLAAQDKAKKISDFVQGLPEAVRNELEKAMGGGGQ